eukprot:TRINITY_DN3181_c0_g2_i2.p1 TRINITY_DN3181_c0_g2~~TRINITY_DN3181_c0_g2_i2.p1  ORF type:complete len:2164 (+),score=920.04 TRINITY_DN3181_c0_g2_i2:38-6529(+)
MAPNQSALEKLQQLKAKKTPLQNDIRVSERNQRFNMMKEQGTVIISPKPNGKSLNSSSIKNASLTKAQTPERARAVLDKIKAKRAGKSNISNTPLIEAHAKEQIFEQPMILSNDHVDLEDVKPSILEAKEPHVDETEVNMEKPEPIRKPVIFPVEEPKKDHIEDHKPLIQMKQKENIVASTSVSQDNSVKTHAQVPISPERRNKVDDEIVKHYEELIENFQKEKDSLRQELNQEREAHQRAILESSRKIKDLILQNEKNVYDEACRLLTENSNTSLSEIDQQKRKDLLSNFGDSELLAKVDTDRIKTEEIERKAKKAANEYAEGIISKFKEDYDKLSKKLNEQQHDFELEKSRQMHELEMKFKEDFMEKEKKLRVQYDKFRESHEKSMDLQLKQKISNLELLYQQKESMLEQERAKLADEQGKFEIETINKANETTSKVFLDQQKQLEDYETKIVSSWEEQIAKLNRQLIEQRHDMLNKSQIERTEAEAKLTTVMSENSIVINKLEAQIRELKANHDHEIQQLRSKLQEQNLKQHMISKEKMKTESDSTIEQMQRVIDSLRNQMEQNTSKHDLTVSEMRQTYNNRIMEIEKDRDEFESEIHKKTENIILAVKKDFNEQMEQMRKSYDERIEGIQTKNKDNMERISSQNEDSIIRQKKQLELIIENLKNEKIDLRTKLNEALIEKEEFWKEETKKQIESVEKRYEEMLNDSKVHYEYHIEQEQKNIVELKNKYDERIKKLEADDAIKTEKIKQKLNATFDKNIENYRFYLDEKIDSLKEDYNKTIDELQENLVEKESKFIEFETNLVSKYADNVNELTNKLEANYVDQITKLKNEMMDINLKLNQAETEKTAALNDLQDELFNQHEHNLQEKLKEMEKQHGEQLTNLKQESVESIKHMNEDFIKQRETLLERIQNDNLNILKDVSSRVDESIRDLNQEIIKKHNNVIEEIKKRENDLIEERSRLTEEMESKELLIFNQKNEEIENVHKNAEDKIKNDRMLLLKEIEVKRVDYQKEIDKKLDEERVKMIDMVKTWENEQLESKKQLEDEHSQQILDVISEYNEKMEAFEKVQNDEKNQLIKNHKEIILAKNEEIERIHKESQEILQEKLKAISLDKIQDDMKLRQQYSNVIQQHIKNLELETKERLEFYEQHLIDIHKDYSEQIKNANLELVRYEVDIKEKYENLLENSQKDNDLALSTRIELNREEWLKREKQFNEVRQEVDVQKQKIDHEYSTKYQQLLEENINNFAEHKREQESLVNRSWEKHINDANDAINESLKSEKRMEIELRQKLMVDQENWLASKQRDFDRREADLVQRETSLFEEKERLKKERETEKIRFEKEMTEKFEMNFNSRSDHLKKEYEDKNEQLNAMIDKRLLEVNEKEKHIHNVTENIGMQERMKALSLIQKETDHLRELRRQDIEKVKNEIYENDKKRSNDQRKLSNEKHQFEVELSLRLQKEKQEIESSFEEQINVIKRDFERKKGELEEKYSEQKRELDQHKLDFDLETRERINKMANERVEENKKFHETVIVELNEKIQGLNDKVKDISGKSSLDKVVYEKEQQEKYEQKLKDEFSRLNEANEVYRNKLESEHVEAIDLEKESLKQDYDLMVLKKTKEIEAKYAVDSEELKNSYEAQLKILESEKNNVIKSLKEEMNSIETNHLNEFKQIKQDYEDRYIQLVEQHEALREQLSNELKSNYEKEKELLIDSLEKEKVQLSNFFDEKYVELSEKEKAINLEADEKIQQFKLLSNEKYHKCLDEIKSQYDEKLVMKSQSYIDHLVVFENKLLVEKQQFEDELEIKMKNKEEELLMSYESKQKELEDQFNIEKEILIKRNEDLLVKANEQRITEINELNELIENERLENEKKLNEKTKQLEEVEEKARNTFNSLKKYKHDISSWKIEYQKKWRDNLDRLMARAKNLMQLQEEKMEKRQLEIDERITQLEEERIMVESERKNLLEKLNSSNEEKFRQQQQQKDVQVQNAKNFSKLKNQIERLWETLETAADDKYNFKAKAETTFEPSDETLKLYEEERIRLEAQIPVVELITKREFIKYKLSEFLKTSTDPSRLYGNSATLQKEESQRRELQEHLYSLTQELAEKLPEYEKLHETPFLFKGQRYYDLMRNDVQKLERDASSVNTKKFRQTNQIKKTPPMQRRTSGGKIKL